MTPLKTLIHVHTDYSYDSNISLADLAAVVESRRIGCIAVTDHDTLEGALRFRTMTNAKVIVGEEITTRQGHLIGLFLRERVRPGMSARDTALAIRAQGGLVFAPHPFVSAFGCGLQDAVWEIADLIHAVEINNAQNLLRRPDRRAAHFAKERKLPMFVGADSHDKESIAPCYQVLREFDGPAEFLSALEEAELFRGRHPIRYFTATALRLVRHYTGLGLPPGFGVNAPLETAGACCRSAALPC
jgi:hypothetical protein